jgi:hypothetical protein
LCKDVERGGLALVMRVFEDVGQSEVARQKFQDESRTLRQLMHPNCAGVVEGRIVEDGLAFRVSRFGEGTPVSTFCDARRMTVPDRIELLTNLCRIFGDMHASDITSIGVKSNDVLAQDNGDSVNLTVVDYGTEWNSAAPAIHRDIRMFGLIALELLTGLSWANCVSEVARTQSRGVREILRHQCFAVPTVARRRQMEPDSVDKVLPKSVSQAIDDCLIANSGKGRQSFSDVMDGLQS